jgi:hypothetical protein
MTNKKNQKPFSPKKEEKSQKEQASSQEKKKKNTPHDIYEDDEKTHGVYESESDYW